MKQKPAIVSLALSFLVLLAPLRGHAHFGMMIPANDIVGEQTREPLKVNLMFAHPFEGQSMKMEKPAVAGVLFNGEKTLFTEKLRPLDLTMYSDKKPSRAWRAYHPVERPGDYVFFMEPKPYWEPAEDSYIVHYTKVIVNAFGKEGGWDEEVGMKTEIIPLSRPYGIYAGNVFQGIVKVDGKPAPFTEVEIEYFNRGGKSTAPSGPFVTQVVKADANGVFTYAIPKAGWWGFAALSTDSRTLPHEGKPKPVEIGAVLWIKAADFR
ncbi:ATP-dependent DNA ligase [Prosthecochloris sp. GSB1]|uniref:DUF4198 domain-containing protein n=1 Tax=Prosthecochloris sp. GSB1 TaxID=281093 RepID=UPI000B8C811B|nr:DUF4198 domain-containing protein [Prosthecochloris sp. GSB1]ASQ90325.1 ATP-dependent DNA ligase [Prosthecochloris sp. GSB1]